jgi:hypothetical protein
MDSVTPGQRLAQDVSDRFDLNEVAANTVTASDLVPGDWVPSAVFPTHRWVWNGRDFVLRRNEEAHFAC